MSVSSLLSRGAVDILEELQILTAKTMEKVEITKQYEVIRELGKGTYGRVDLVIHKARGETYTMELGGQRLQKKFLFHWRIHHLS